MVSCSIPGNLAISRVGAKGGAGAGKISTLQALSSFKRIRMFILTLVTIG